MSFDPNAIGNRIFTLRTNAKLSQEKLAEKLGVSHRHLGDLERGSSNSSVKILIDIAESSMSVWIIFFWAEILLGISFKMNCKPL